MMTAPTGKTPEDVIAFWRAAGWEKWFVKDSDFDAEFRDRFMELHLAAARRQCDDWIDTAESALALIILLDQFPRNAFRATGHMFATDPLAVMFARQAIEKGHDKAFDKMLAGFLYLPFEHSEALADQQRSVRLFSTLGEPWMKYAEEHLAIIERFGRFPHRNQALGRTSTDEELAYLANGGFAG